VNGDVHRLARVGDEVAPVADVADDQLLPQLKLKPEIGPVGIGGCGLQTYAERSPDGEVLAELLEAVEQRIWQVATILCLPSRAGGGALQRVELLPCGRQLVERDHTAEDDTVVIDVNEMPRIALGIVRRSCRRDVAGG
jgi:hypothetical protein